MKILRNNVLLILLVVGLISSLSLCYKVSKSNRKLKKLVESLESQLHTKSVFDFYQISELEKEKLEKLSKSQLKQDIFAYLELGRKERGFFVEFGATNGVSLSNSYMLERDFGWNGILAEPAKIWHDQLKANRPNSIIETLCIWKDSGSKLTFNQTNDNELSTIDKYSDHDMHEKARKNGEKYDVVTISLLDLFKKHNAPQVIDYLSIDTEGSEFEILEAFFRDNDYYEIKIITCEHNFTPNREKIFELLKKYGYQRKYQVISAFDDFYVLQK